MEISVAADGTIRQHGQSLGELDDCTIQEIDDDLAVALAEPGVKTLNADGTITVTPPAPAPESGPDPRVAAVQALIATATSPEQADALRQFAEAFGIALP